MKSAGKILGALILVVCALLMLVSREADEGEPSEEVVTSVPLRALPVVRGGRKSAIAPVRPADQELPALPNPFTPEMEKRSLGERGDGVAWDVVLNEKHEAAVLTSIGESVVATLEKRAARREPDPKFDNIGGPWTSLEEDYLNKWGLSGNVGPPTREEGAGLARHRANAGIMYPHSGYETDEYYVLSLPWRSPGSEPVNDIFHAGYACRKADGLVFAWTLPQVNRDEILAERGIDAEADRAKREAWMADQREQAKERARRAMDARRKKSGR